jgi:hypothetical protein
MILMSELYALAEAFQNIKDCSKLTLWRMGIFTRRYRCWRLSKEHQPGEEVDILIYGL